MKIDRSKRTKSQADLAARVDRCLQLLVAGYSPREIHAWSIGQGWDVSRRTVSTYCARASAALRAESQKNRAAEFGKVSLRLERLYRIANKAEDVAQALAVTNARIRLFGLAEPERQAVDHTSGGKPLRTEIVIVPRGSPPDAKA